MVENFNLLLLHEDYDKHPRSWICVSGEKLPAIVQELENLALKKMETTREALSRKLAEELGCSNIFKKFFSSKQSFYPIPFIAKLAEMVGNKKYLGQINPQISYLKVNSASAKPIKAIKSLNINIAKILGAFMADGSLSIQAVFAADKKEKIESAARQLSENNQIFYEAYSRARKQFYISLQKNKLNEKLIDKLLKESKLSQCHYGIELSDAYEDNVRFFAGLIEKEFSITPISCKKIENKWRVIYSNKILARYFTNFFEAWPGEKCKEAFEPRRIKKSTLTIRKAFALGAIAFDGCVTKGRKIAFSSISKAFAESIAEVWREDNIKFYFSESKPKNSEIEYTVGTHSNTPTQKLIQYLEPNTQKWKLLKWLNGDLTQNPVLQELSIAKVSESRMLELIKKIGSCDATFLKNYFNCRHTTIRDRLKTLMYQKLIKLSAHINSIDAHYVDSKTTVALNQKYQSLLFETIRKKFVYDQEFAKTILCHKATLSAWRKQKSRIPINKLEKMCNELSLNFGDFCNNLTETDREIATILY